MKQDLMELISAMPTIETHFRKFEPVEGLCVPSGEFIYDDSEFIEWQEAVKFELQEIFDRTKDTYIWNIINVNGVIHKFDGKNYNEKEGFNKLKGSLSVIQKNIDKYYSTEMEKREDKEMIKSKIFISHSSEDLKYVEPFVELLADIGLTNENIFCSSVPDYAIPIN